MALTKIDIVEKVADQLNFSKNESVDIVECFLSIIKHTLASGEDIKISGFGNFEIKQKKPRRGRNPQTGDTITIEARRILSFKTSNKLKKTITD